MDAEELDPGEVDKVLQKISTALGVRKPALRALLTPDLCEWWHVYDEDPPETVRAKVVWHLERAIGRVPGDGRERTIARVSFNLGYNEIAELHLGDRQKVFQGNREGWPRIEPPYSFSEVRDDFKVARKNLAESICRNPAPAPPSAELDMLIKRYGGRQLISANPGQSNLSAQADASETSAAENSSDTADPQLPAPVAPKRRVSDRSIFSRWMVPLAAIAIVAIAGLVVFYQVQARSGPSRTLTHFTLNPPLDPGKATRSEGTDGSTQFVFDGSVLTIVAVEATIVSSEGLLDQLRGGLTIAAIQATCPLEMEWHIVVAGADVRSGKMRPDFLGGDEAPPSFSTDVPFDIKISPPQDRFVVQVKYILPDLARLPRCEGTQISLSLPPTYVPARR